MGQRPNFKHQCWGEEKKAVVMLLFHRDKMPISQIARQVGLSTRMVRYHIAAGKEAAGKVTTELAQAMRQLETLKIHRDDEKARLVWDELQLAADRLGKMIENPSDKVAVVAANALARVGEAVARLREASNAGSAQISKLWGLYMPVRIQEEQLRVSYQKTESKILISFDRSPIEALARQPVPGLTITAGCEHNGNGTKQLHDTDALSVAGDLPGNGSAALS